jgi:short-chain fatty acids transporter
MRKAIRGLAEKLHFGMEKVMPDSFIFAVILTFIVFILAMVVVGAGPIKIVESWHRGFWAYLAFSMQMTILLIFGYSMAITKPGTYILDKLTGVAKTPAGAVAWVSFLASMLCLVNWGLGLAGSIFLCLGTARRVKGVHWPLLVASAYIGCMATTAYSVSITEPLLLNQPGWGWPADVVPTVEKAIGQKLAPMGFEKTIYAPASIVAFIISPLLCALLCYLMHPAPEKTKPINQEALKGLSAMADFESRLTRGTDIADRLNWSRTLWILISLLTVVAAVLWFRGKSFLQLDLNMFNFLFIVLALVLHGSIPRFVESVKRATEASYGIILQFPFYAGIFGIMAYTGLLQAIANWFGSMATPFIYPLVVMISAGIINIFIPSSGGIWMVQGPPTIMAAAQLGVSFNRVAMAFTAGEVITNAIQPFWALPLLGATKTEMRNIMGYCIVSTTVLFIAVALCYLYLPM